LSKDSEATEYRSADGFENGGVVFWDGSDIKPALAKDAMFLVRICHLCG
jgi:hypothetical protein